MTPAFHFPAFLVSILASAAFSVHACAAPVAGAPSILKPAEASDVPAFHSTALEAIKTRSVAERPASDKLLFEALPGLEEYLDAKEPSLPSLSAQAKPARESKETSTGEHYPWRNEIVTTTFWVGEGTTKRNPVANHSSSWDRNWAKNFGGLDDPDRANRADYIPVKFTPKQNPFYCALPYNDTTRGTTKPEASRVIPWFSEAYEKPGKSVLKGRWIAIRYNGKVAYAQWEDCGPFRTDHWQYVFGNERPKPNLNKGAGLDVSPAVRDFLGMRDTDVTDWRFVDFQEVPNGPWARLGENNTFVLNAREATKKTAMADAAEAGSKTIQSR